MMDRFPRGTLPPSAMAAITLGAPAAETPRKLCDLTMTCPVCAILMQPEHAHYRCRKCGYRDSCCF